MVLSIQYSEKNKKRKRYIFIIIYIIIFNLILLTKSLFSLLNN